MSMVLLQSMDKFDVVAELDVSNGNLQWLSKQAHPDLRLKTVGVVAELRGHVLCIYRIGGILYFRIDDQTFEIDNDTKIDLVKITNMVNRIDIYRKGALVFEWPYERPQIHPPLEIDPTPFVEEEDFDLCLLAYNIAKDPGRKERAFR